MIWFFNIFTPKGFFQFRSEKEIRSMQGPERVIYLFNFKHESYHST